MSKALLVMAASVYQIPAIVTAKRLGLRVVTTDNAPGNSGHKLADACYSIDTTDRNGILELVRRERLDGVLCVATDVAVRTAAFVSEQAGLPGPPLAAAEVLTDKLAFRSFLKAAGLPCPDAVRVTASELPDSKLFDRGRWIIKPNRSSGSKGVMILEEFAELTRYWGESAAFSLDGTVLLEQYLNGSQHTCEGILHQSQVVYALVTDRETAPAPFTATCGHRVPSRLGSSAQTKLLAMLENIFERLGVSEGPFDCDFVVEGETITLIEVSPRLGGNSLPTLIREAHGVDLVEYAVRTACGMESELPACFNTAPVPTAVLILGVGRAGKLRFEASQAIALSHAPWVRYLRLDYAIGHPVLAFTNSRNRVGEAVVTAEDRDELDHRVDELRARLALDAA